MNLPSLPFLAEAFSTVLKRFPLVMLVSFLGVFAAMNLIEENTDDLENVFVAILVTCALGLPALIFAAILSEKQQWKGLLGWIPSLLVGLLLVLYYFSLDFEEDHDHFITMIRFAGFNLTAHLLVAFTPYLDRTPVEDFWEYNKQLFGNFLVGAFYSMVIFTGLSVAILAIDNLFNLDISEKIYGHLFITIAGVVNTAFFLFHFPERYEGIAQGEVSYLLAVKNLCKFILIPIVGIYFLILYAYSIKILLNWELPRGWVSSLVLGFSVAGILTYLLNYSLPEIDKSQITAQFRKWFFFVLFPMIILLFVAIGRRMQDYGVTEERYLVASLGVWLLLLSVYFMLSQKDNIKFIPVSLAFFSFLCVIGPFGMFKVSERSQTGRLEKLLTENGMLKEGKVVPGPDSLSEETSNEIRSILYYLRSYDHFAPVASWFDMSENPDWEAVDSLINKLDLFRDNTDEFQYCHLDFKMPISIELSAYQGMIMSGDIIWQPRDTGNLLTALVQEGENVMELKKGEETVDRVDMLPYLTFLSGKYECLYNETQKEDALYQLEGERYELQLLTEWVAFEKNETLKLRSWKGVILWRNRE